MDAATFICFTDMPYIVFETCTDGGYHTTKMIPVDQIKGVEVASDINGTYYISLALKAVPSKMQSVNMNKADAIELAKKYADAVFGGNEGEAARLAKRYAGIGDAVFDEEIIR